MPRLPSAADFDRQTPNPSRQIAGYQTGQVEAAAKAMGAAVSSVGQEFDQMFAREQERVTNLQTEESLNELRNRQLVRSYGKDGFLSVKGGDVLSRPILKEYPDLFKRDIEEVSSRLKSPLAQEKFRARAGSLATSFNADVYRHVMSESEKYDETVFAGTVETETNHAGQNWNRPESVEVSLGRVNATLAKRFTDRGITDPQTQKAMRQKYLGGIHSVVMQSALANKDYQFAADYLKANETDMDSAKANILRKDIEVLQKKSAEEEAGRMAVDTARYVYEAYLPASNAPIDRAAAVKGVEESMKGLPPEYTAKAISYFDHLVTERNDTVSRQERESKGALLTEFNKVHTRSKMMEIYGSPAFLALPAEQQGELSGYMERDVESRENRLETETRMAANEAERKRDQARRDAKEEYKEWERSPQVMMTIQSLTEREDFYTMSAAELRSYEPQIGKRNMDLVEKTRQRDMEKSEKFKFDEKLYKDAIPKAILPSKDKVNAFGGTAKILLEEWRQQHLGKVPTPQEQIDILQGALEEWKVIDGAGGFLGVDVTRKRYEAQGKPGAVPKSLYDKAESMGIPTDMAFAETWANEAEEARKRGKQLQPERFLDAYKKMKRGVGYRGK